MANSSQFTVDSTRDELEAARDWVAPSSPGPERSLDVLQRFLARASIRTERGVAYARLILATLAFGQYLVFNFASLLRGNPKGLSFAFGLALAIGYSVWTLRRLSREDRLLPQLIVSVAVDAAVFAVVMAGILMWPRADYGGILRVPDVGILLVGLVATGFRLSGRVAIFGIFMFLAVQLAALLVDAGINGPRITYNAEDITTWSVLAIGAGALGYAIAIRTKSLVYDGAEAALKEERARQRLGIYVSEEVAQEALDSVDLKVGGKRQPVAVLFSDLRGFTRYSEKLPPEHLVSELNAYLDAMVKAIRANGGVVDKFIGDAIMVVFGIPRSRADDAARAIRTAMEMEQSLRAHNAERSRANKPPFRHGIGIHYGTAVAGNIGNKARLQYTVIGDVVNLASRLQDATKVAGRSVLISGAVVDAARKGAFAIPELESVGDTSLRDVKETVSAYTLAEVSATDPDPPKR